MGISDDLHCCFCTFLFDRLRVVGRNDFHVDGDYRLPDYHVQASRCLDTIVHVFVFY